MKKFTMLWMPFAFSLCSFAQANPIHEVACEQTNGYLGGYTLHASATDPSSTELKITVQHHLGPDGDGFYQAPVSYVAEFSNSSTSNTSIYSAKEGVLNLNPSSSSAVYTNAGGSNLLTCRFTFFSATPETANSSVARCAQAITQHDSTLTAILPNSAGGSSSLNRYAHGFAAAQYEESAQVIASIVLETSSEIYFYAETSDIGATIYQCDSSTAQIKEFANAHALGCEDLPTVQASEILYSSCKN